MNKHKLNTNEQEPINETFITGFFFYNVKRKVRKGVGGNNVFVIYEGDHNLRLKGGDVHTMYVKRFLFVFGSMIPMMTVLNNDIVEE